MLNRPKAVLFDMGGVLQDASVVWDAEAWRRANPAQTALPEPFAWFMEMSRECLAAFLTLPVPRPAFDVRPLIAEWLARRGEEANAEAVEHWFRTMCAWEVQPIYPHVRQALSEIRTMGPRMGVVSNTVMPGDRLRVNFAEAGILEFFEVTVFSAEVGTNKPDPAIFRHALERMHLDPKDTWYVGDKPQRDVCGAHRAGMTAVLVDSAHVGRTADRPENVPDLRIKDISELPDALKRVG